MKNREGGHPTCYNATADQFSLLLHRFRFHRIHGPLTEFNCDGWLEYDIVRSDNI
jgi:hypothetical protein